VLIVRAKEVVLAAKFVEVILADRSWPNFPVVKDFGMTSVPEDNSHNNNLPSSPTDPNLYALSVEMTGSNARPVTQE
jgi:hypothetical protein